MKTLYLILFIFILNICNAQTYPIIEEGIGLEEGVYYKDTYNELNKFSGIWRYQSGNIIFEIAFQKKTMLYNPDFNNYCDILIGEYRYIIGTETIVNTMANLQQDMAPYKNNIAGANIKDLNLPASERRVLMAFTDPERSYLNRDIIVKHLPAVGSTPEKIEIEFRGEMSVVPDDSSPTTLRVPEQNYTLTKVP